MLRYYDGAAQVIFRDGDASRHSAISTNHCVVTSRGCIGRSKGSRTASVSLIARSTVRYSVNVVSLLTSWSDLSIWVSRTRNQSLVG